VKLLATCEMQVTRRQGVKDPMELYFAVDIELFVSLYRIGKL